MPKATKVGRQPVIPVGTEPMNCAVCDSPAEVISSECKTYKYDIRCSNKDCRRQSINCKRLHLDQSIMFWNKVQAAKKAGTYERKVYAPRSIEGVTPDVPRCKVCNLVLPCNDCLKDITFYATARRGDYNPPSARVRPDRG